MAKASYTYTIEGEFVKIVDLNRGTSVTNDAEGVLTEINHSLENIETKRVIYLDSLGNWDEILPEWSSNGNCIDVTFKTYKS
jgi:hypothetical protein